MSSVTDPWTRFIIDCKRAWEIFHETTHDPELCKLKDYAPFFKHAVREARESIKRGSYDDTLENVMFAHGVRSLQWIWNEDMGKKPGPSEKWNEILAPFKAWILKRYGKKTKVNILGALAKACHDMAKQEDPLTKLRRGEKPSADPPKAKADDGKNKRNANFLKICGHPKAGGDKLGWLAYEQALHDKSHRNLRLGVAKRSVEKIAEEAVKADDLDGAIYLFAMAKAISEAACHRFKENERDKYYDMLGRFNELLAPYAEKIVARMK